jgi:hypothetical protein
MDMHDQLLLSKDIYLKFSIRNSSNKNVKFNFHFKSVISIFPAKILTLRQIIMDMHDQLLLSKDIYLKFNIRYISNKNNKLN